MSDYYTEIMNTWHETSLQTDTTLCSESIDESCNLCISDDIVAMTRTMTNLTSIPQEMQNADYRKIVKYVNEYLIKHCQHNIVTDSIDIDVDMSETIHYCQICFQTFEANPIKMDGTKNGPKEVGELPTATELSK